MGDWLTIPPVTVAFVDGVYSSRPELREYAELVLWVTTSEEERVRRQVERGRNQSVWIQRWMAAENYYLEQIHQPDFLRTGIYLAAGGDRPDISKGNTIENNEISGYGMSRHCIAGAPGVKLTDNTIAKNECSDDEAIALARFGTQR